MTHHNDRDSRFEISVVTLGTAGGPRWWQGDSQMERNGIATAIVVPGGFYLVDCGLGVGRQLARAGLNLKDLRGVFITHLHSDHIVDLSSLLLFGMSVTSTPPENRVPIIGPGNRGVLPPLSPHASFEPRLPDEENPVPGTTEMVELLIRAYGTDVADRVRDALRPAPDEIFHALDIQIPSSAGFHPNEASHPTIEPFTVWEDENVSVRATLVDHPPLAPAYAFRFETSQGSIVVSGDTAPSENLVLLAKDADILLHEAIDFDAISLAYEGVSEQVRNASMDHHRKSHTSASQAAEIANIANVKTLVLHHLVPGNVSRASWKEGAASFRGQLVIAEDLGVLHLGDGTKQ